MDKSKKPGIFHYVDYRVSGKQFSLVPNEDGTILKTEPQPPEDELPLYYESEDYISHTDSKNSFQDKLYQWVKRMMLKRKLSWIKEFHQGGNMLDVGAGTLSLIHI